MTERTDYSDDIIELAIIVTPSFNSFATLGFIDPFRAANYLEGRRVFRWRLISEQGGICVPSSGVGIETAAIQDLEGYTPKIVLISSSWTPEVYATKAIQSATRRWRRQGATIAGLDTGAFIMAQSGLLRNRRATVHYEHIDALKETYPETDVLEDLFVFDGPYLSCCGGTAAVDFALHILRETSGQALANAAARYIFHPAVRKLGAWQQPIDRDPFGATVPAIVRQVIQVMEQHLEDPLSIPEVCERVDLSQRQVDRLFAKHIRKSPALYYRDIRLDRARGLVTQTDLKISEIAVASGFASPVHFSRAYKARFGLSPVRDRVEGRVPFEFRAWPMYRKVQSVLGDGEEA
ncbi:GlxA family transcriptional regulator [Nioella sp.]|uniref:GlxA family transcriptional regulator n=1 Tax=Nioella sp. TaxID=1912091 RepID=UPI003B51A743